MTNSIVTWGNRDNFSVLDIYKKIKENMISYMIEPTIYNYLILAWISKNLPLKNNIVSFEDFKYYFWKLYPNAPLNQEILYSFYSEACKEWKKLNNPNIADIRNACLKIVAFAINNRIKWHNESFGISIYLAFDVMLSKDHFLIPNQAFVSLIRDYLSIEWYDEKILKKATHEFYKFAERFIIVDLPLTSIGENFLMLFKLMARNKFDDYCENYLDIIEDKLNQDYFQKVDMESHNLMLTEELSHWDRLQFIASRIYETRYFMMERMRENIITNYYFIILDRNFQILNKIKSFTKITDKILIIGKNQVYNRFTQFTTCIYFTINDVLHIIIDYSSSVGVEESMNFLRNKFKGTKEILIEKYKNVIKISLSSPSIEKYTGQIKKEVRYLFEQIKQLDIKKTKNMTNIIYYDALNAIKAKKRLVTLN